MKKVISPGLIFVGFLLSPLSWWNDIIINIPLAYLFSFPFILISNNLFLPSFIIGYLLTNILGFTIMHKGIQLYKESSSSPIWKELKKNLLISLLYTILVFILVLFDIIKSPADLLK